MNNRLEELKNSESWYNRREYARATGDWNHLKNDEEPDNRLEYARATGDWQHLKYDESWLNRREYARATGDWQHLKNDEDLENCAQAEYYLNLTKPKIKEFTLKEIAEKMGVDVNDLRIKDE